ncbi:MAG: hypothetical protein J5925_00605 [Clostridia bacterium]|nr:hypothetical protein [Clostridia bacterium]
MTVAELKNRLSLNALCLPRPEREITGGFAGDLLSWVMGGAKEGDAWVTIMSNLNVIAVASLCDTACVVLASGTVPDEKDLATAREKEINVLNSPLTEFELCVKIGELLK